jgi:predicted RNA-binding Zn-ribbon protein involved in translation (DUF1610 family)
MDDKDINIWCSIIEKLISDAEKQTEHTCADCGEYYSLFSDQYDNIIL